MRLLARWPVAEGSIGMVGDELVGVRDRFAHPGYEPLERVLASTADTGATRTIKATTWSHGSDRDIESPLESVVAFGDSRLYSSLSPSAGTIAYTR